MAAFRSFRTYVGLSGGALVVPRQTYLPTLMPVPHASFKTYLPTSRWGKTSARRLRASPAGTGGQLNATELMEAG